MAYSGQKYAKMLSLNFGSRRDVGSTSRSVRFPLREEKTRTLWIEVVPAPEPVWVFWRGEISLAAAALLTGKELIMHIVMDWNINVNFTLQQATKTQRRGTALIFFNLGARCVWVVNATLRPIYLATPLQLYLRNWPDTQCTGGRLC